MTRHFLFIFTLCFALTLGWTQRLPLAAICVGIGIVFWTGILSTDVRRCLVYGCIGVGCAMICTQVRLPRLLVTVGQQLQVTGVVSKNTNGQSLMTIQQCDQRPCPTGVLVASELPLGEHIRVECELLPLPDPQQPWRWWKQGIAAECVLQQKIQHLTITMLGRLFRFRQSLRTRIDQSFPPRSAGLFAGILFGDISSMPSVVSTDFRRTGTTHIVALSGFNITIILQTVVGGLLPIFGRRWTTYLGLGLVCMFVVTTGASSSVVRAAVMAAVVQGVRLSGRPIHPDRLLLVAIVLMSLQNPWLLWHDLGFQLSMSSTFGLLQLRPSLEGIGRWLPEMWEIRDNALSTVAASLASAPILLATFGGWSVISLLANIIVLPAIPIIMGMGVLTLPFLWIPEDMRMIFLAPVDLLMRGVLESLHQLAQVPWAYTIVPTWGILLAITATILIIGICYAHSQRSLR